MLEESWSKQGASGFVGHEKSPQGEMTPEKKTAYSQEKGTDPIRGKKNTYNKRSGNEGRDGSWMGWGGHILSGLICH